MEYDFSGWATKNNIECSDGRTIIKDAFKINDGMEVPLVWQHQHNDVDNVLGHMRLENREDGVYSYGYFNNTEKASVAKELINHGDITSLSIYANNLKQKDGKVFHGNIREVSLVLAGANPGAFIDYVIQHGETIDDAEEAVLYLDLGFDNEDRVVEHKESEKVKKNEDIKEPKKEETLKSLKKNEEDDLERSAKDIFEGMTQVQKDAVYAIIGQIVEDTDKNKEKEDEEEMKHNVFDVDDNTEVLQHDDMMDIIADGKKYGSLKESVLQHGIENIGVLFPDAKSVDEQPVTISRPMDWVNSIMSGVKRTPFSRIKSSTIDVTGEAARAKGYTKGKKKTEEIVTALKRSTDPTTIYKKQKLDRDDVIDITDFDVVSWIKKEMRIMLDEEIARAILIGDGRVASHDDKIEETKIRPIWTDDDVYTLKETVATATSGSDADRAKEFIRTAIKARKNYRGSGSPTLYITEDMLTEMLLLEDNNGRQIYDSETKLATALRVSKIVSVPVMENQTREDGAKTKQLIGIIVNIHDYTVGADKGGSVNMFDDFDIDYNAQKYLIETRCSGALTTPASAIAIEAEVDKPQG